MKFKSLLFFFFALTMGLVGCQDKNAPQTPKIELDKDVLNFEAEVGEQFVLLTSTRKWEVSVPADWVKFNPKQGSAVKGEKIQVTVLFNTGEEREVKAVFSIGTVKKELTIRQKGNSTGGGGTAGSLLYLNDFDGGRVEKVKNKYWPYLDQSEVWKHHSGEGSANVQYIWSKGVSVRAGNNVASDNAEKSNYKGSGKNNIYFGADVCYLGVTGISVSGAGNYKMSLGLLKSAYPGKAEAQKEGEFKLFVTKDGQNWAELPYTLPSEVEKYNLIETVFSLPEGVNTIGIAVQSNLKSNFRMDDLKLEAVSENGKAVDFSNTVTFGGDPAPVPTPTPTPTPTPAPEPAPAPSGDKFANTLSFALGVEAQNFNLTVNGSSQKYPAVKIGTGKNKGSFTLTVPQGTKTIGFYACGWNKENSSIKVTHNDTDVTTLTLKANSGFSGGGQTFTVTVTDADHYTVDVSSLTGSGDVTLTFVTSGGKNRGIFFGLQKVQ